MNAPHHPATSGTADRSLLGEELDPTSAIEFRQALGRYASGVVVVTAIEPDGELIGMTCQSFCSLSLAPPLVMFCPSIASTSFPRIRRIGTLCINVLGDDQAHLSTQFSCSGTDKWRGVDWTAGHNGAPRIRNAVLWCEGDIDAEHPGGDHRIVVVRSTALTTVARSRPPLLYHNGRYASVRELTELA